MLRLRYFYHKLCLGCRRIAKMIPGEVEMVDVETGDGEELAIAHGVETIPTLVAIVDGLDDIQAFCKILKGGQNGSR